MFAMTQSHIQLWARQPLLDGAGNPTFAPAGVFPDMQSLANHIMEKKLLPANYIILACAVLQSPLQLSSPVRGEQLNGIKTNGRNS